MRTFQTHSIRIRKHYGVSLVFFPFSIQLLYIEWTYTSNSSVVWCLIFHAHLWHVNEQKSNTPSEIQHARIYIFLELRWRMVKSHLYTSYIPVVFFGLISRCVHLRMWWWTILCEHQYHSSYVRVNANIWHPMRDSFLLCMLHNITIHCNAFCNFCEWPPSHNNQLNQLVTAVYPKSAHNH